MWRYLQVSLAIGAVVSVVLVGLCQTSLFGALGAGTRAFYEGNPMFAEDLAVQLVRPLQSLLIVFLSFSLAWCTVDIPRLGMKVLVAVLAAILVLTISPALALYGVLFEPVLPVAAVLGALGLGLAYGATEQGRRKKVLLSMIGGRVSKPTVRRLIGAKEPLELGGEERDVSVLTCRFFNHEELYGEMDSDDLVDMTNMFLQATTEFLLDRGAYLDESAPDCVRVFFGMPEVQEKHAERACRAALELRLRLANLSTECESRWNQKPKFGVALASGSLILGLYGSGAYTHYGAVGGLIDFCRRLSTVNLHYGTVVLADASVFAACRGAFEFRPIERFRIAEYDVLTEVYEPLCEVGSLSAEESERRDQFWKGLILLREDKPKEATAALEASVAEGGAPDPVLDLYLQRARMKLHSPAPEPALSESLAPALSELGEQPL